MATSPFADLNLSPDQMRNIAAAFRVYQKDMADLSQKQKQILLHLTRGVKNEKMDEIRKKLQGLSL